MSFEKRYMQRAIQLSINSVHQGGGPFGAVIVKAGQIVATGNNRVTLNCDPTAHAEIIAIRRACRRLRTFDLSGCELYASCEPCPMCLSAIYWAHIDKIYYANRKTDAQAIGFDDAFIYNELERQPEQRRLKAEHIDGTNAIDAFELWTCKTDKTEY